MLGLARDGIEEMRFRLHMLPALEGWVLQIRSFSHGDVDGKLVNDLLLERVWQSVEDMSQPTWNFRPHPGEPEARVNATQTLSSTNINPVAIRQINKWLRICTEEHTDCRGQGGLEALPPHSIFRLVDVGTHKDDNIRIVEVSHRRDAAESQEEYNRYITLSYRWTDEVKRTNLTTENKAEFERSIPTSNWPKVYWDAVSMAHQLSVRYLWIDSLCIIQNQKEDWIKQAALMGDIYSGGLLNLAAVGGQSLEVLRNPLRVAPCVLTQHAPRPDAPATRWLCYRPDDIRKAVDRAPLSKRGWCFQERLVSRRSVHFGDQLFWECTTLRASEAFPLTIDVPLRQEYIDAAISNIKVALKTEIMGSQGRSLHRLWGSVLRCYTSTELTKPSDRLIALRGIANIVARQFDLSSGDYLAGLWRPSIAFQLLWARESEAYSNADEELACKLANHFPSWSWASCPGETRFIDLEDSESFSQSLVWLDSAQASDDANRAAVAPFLILRGSLVRCDHVVRWLASQNHDRLIKAMVSTTSSGSGCNGDGDVSSAGTVDAVEIELDRPVSHLYSAFYLLPVLLKFGTVRGLVLAMTDRMGERMVAYRRLGYFSAHGTKLIDMLVPRSRGGPAAPVDNLEAVHDTLPPFILL